MAGDPRGSRPAGPSREHFLTLFEANYTRVLAYALRRTSDRDEAEEIAAETFTIAWRRRDEMPAEDTAWLYGVAALVMSNHRRARRRQLRLRGRISHELPALGRDPADTVAERDAIASAFRQLSEPQRELLRLISWEGLDAREAAIALGCSNAAFRVRLHRARSSLAKHLEAGGHTESTTKLATNQEAK